MLDGSKLPEVTYSAPFLLLCLLADHFETNLTSNGGTSDVRTVARGVQTPAVKSSITGDPSGHREKYNVVSTKVAQHEPTRVCEDKKTAR